jgi:hypothetical protein
MNSLERFPTLRQSRLAVFDSCALRASFEESYRRGWSSHPAARGQFVHRVLARALRVMFEHGENRISADVILELFFDELRMVGSELANVPFRELKDVRWVLVKFANDIELDIASLVDIEQRLSATLDYEDSDGSKVQRTLTGRLDVAFAPSAEEIVVVDYKDTWDLPAQSDLGFEGYFQQRFYAWLVMRNYPGVERVTLREHYLRYSQFREACVYRDDLPDTEAQLSALAARFDRAFDHDEFPPSPGRHCSMCALPAKCPIFSEVRLEGMIADEAMARRVAGEAIVAREAYKTREKALRAWASVHGPVAIISTVGRERVWGYRQAKRVTRPTREEVEKQLFLNGSRIDLDALYKEQVATRFEAHSPQEHEHDDSCADARIAEMLERSLSEEAA